MNLLSDVITYIRRIVKTPSNASLSDNLIIDYINRFWLMDVDARIQLFDLKTKYQFMTTPGVDQYNMPLYSVQTEPGGQQINFFPVYQGFEGPAYVNGIQMPFHTQRDPFFNIWPSYVQQLPQTATGDGTAGPYTLQLPFLPNSTSAINPVTSGIIRGHVDITGIIATNSNQDPPVTPNFITTIPTTSVYSAVYFTATASDGSNIIVADSGQFLTANQNYGLLMQPGAAPLGNLPLGPGPNGTYSTTQNTINYQTGIATNVTFPQAIPTGNPIGSSCIFYELGLPRAVLYYNNIITLRAPPNTQYLVELDAYLSPAAFLSTTQALPFGYMAEYLARGAARKILADTGDIEQFQFYEPLFKEQEVLVWKRSQRQFTSTRTQTIFSGQGFQSMTGNSGQGLS